MVLEITEHVICQVQQCVEIKHGQRVDKLTNAAKVNGDCCQCPSMSEYSELTFKKFYRELFQYNLH